jgi:hypothetical protein
MQRVRSRGLVALGCAITVVVGGCGSSDDGDSSSSQAAPSAPTSTAKPTVRFLMPKPRAKINGALKAKVALTNFHIAPKAVGQAPRPGQGHLHFRMDHGKFDFPKYSGPNGLIAKQLGVTGHYSPALTPFITYKHLPPGKHELEVYLANNNHTSVGIEATVKFTVR